MLVTTIKATSRLSRTSRRSARPTSPAPVRRVSVILRRSRRSSPSTTPIAPSPSGMPTSISPSARIRIRRTASSTYRSSGLSTYRGIRSVSASVRRGSTISRKKSSPEGQADGFRRHIAAARITGLPLEIHTRDADADTIRILEEEYGKGSILSHPALLHRRRSAGPPGRRARSHHLVLGCRDVQEIRGARVRLPPRCRWIGCWSRPDGALPGARALPRQASNELAFVVHTAAAPGQGQGHHARGDRQRPPPMNFHRLFSKVPRALSPVAQWATEGHQKGSA